MSEVYEKLDNEEWTPTLVKNIKKGDVFRIKKNSELYEPWRNAGFKFIAIAEPYKFNDEWVVEFRKFKQKYFDILHG